MVTPHCKKLDCWKTTSATECVDMVFGVNLSSFCESEEGRVLNSYVYFVYSTVKRYSGRQAQ